MEVEELLQLIRDCAQHGKKVVTEKETASELEEMNQFKEGLKKLYELYGAKTSREREAIGRYLVSTIDSEITIEQSLALEIITDKIADEPERPKWRMHY